MHYKSAASKRARWQQRCGVVSLAGSASAMALYIAFAYVHDYMPHAANTQAVQAALLGAAIASAFVALGAILVGVEK